MFTIPDIHSALEPCVCWSGAFSEEEIDAIIEMRVKIYAGTPMLHVIPYKREDITAEVGMLTNHEHGLANFTYRTKSPGFYRKWLHQKKTTEITYLK